MDERQAAEALVIAEAQQDRARRAARLPWWVYAAMFVLAVAGGASNDFVSVSGSKLIAVFVLAALVVVLVAGFVLRSAPLSRIRGVEARKSLLPRVFGLALFVDAAVTWLLLHYGTGFAHTIANAVGLPGYPNTVMGVLCGLVFTALFALGQSLTTRSARPAAR
ncbi:hypothetical protein [Sciscionella marina]|uniref:hypothetical protein n=1 Tax=Sciscionella marina TaxID=508770 RepID=UPI0003711AC9|nr:hypothetical protein [Sciscionella marina]